MKFVRLNHEEFVEELKKQKPDITVLSEFQGMNKSI